MTLTLNVQGRCEGNIPASVITMNSDWAMNHGDYSFTYDHSSYFSCLGVTPAPTYSVTVPDSAFSSDTTSRTVTWPINLVSADTTMTVTVVGTLQSPHT
jgi:hypothetical protein